MNKTVEDNIGKLAMLSVFGYIAYQQTISVAGLIANRAAVPMWQLTLTSQIFGTVFLFMILYFTITRLPPRDSAAGLEPRITAVVGTFVMMLLIVLPAGQIGPQFRMISTVLVVIGTVLSMLCIRRLGRSFSIMATARKLVTEGPYSIIRHPLYGAEVVTIVGVVMGHGTLEAVALGLVWLGLQVRRAQNEERVLRATFPEYEEYARRVPMLMPGFMMPNSARN